MLRTRNLPRCLFLLLLDLMILLSVGLSEISPHLPWDFNGCIPGISVDNVLHPGLESVHLDEFTSRNFPFQAVVPTSLTGINVESHLCAFQPPLTPNNPPPILTIA